MKKLLLFTLLFFTITIFGQNSYVISLDGTKSFFVNDDANNRLDLTGSYTFECWLYLKSFQKYDRIMDRRTVMDFQIIDPIGTDAGHDFGIQFNERDGNDNILRSIKTNTADEDMSLNTWYHVAVTFDGSACRLYVNSTLVGYYEQSLWNLSASTNAINFGGRYWGGYGYQIDANIDEIRISNIARSINDMQTSITDAPYASDANTVLLMHLDDQGDPPTYISGIGLNGSSGDDDITSFDYINPNGLPLPVELTSFTTVEKDGKVILNWQTATEVNNYGFEIERSSTPLGTISDKSNTDPSTDVWETIGFVEGHGNSNSPKDYNFIDDSPLNGVISYRLKQIDNDGNFEHSEIINIELKNIGEFILNQNHPNPFNPSTIITYEIPSRSFVSLKVFNSIGQIVTTLVNQEQGSGRYNVEFNANNLSSGFYFYSLTAGRYSSVKKMMLIR